MINEYDAELQVGQEADDALSIAACTLGHGIATIDKDLDGCPGWHYNWAKENIYYVTEVEANRFFYTQMLTGDSTDNIPGLFKRTGKKAMAKVKAPLAELTDPADMYAYVGGMWTRSRRRRCCLMTTTSPAGYCRKADAYGCVVLRGSYGTHRREDT